VARAEHTDSFPLQKGLIFESMPLTAEVPVRARGGSASPSARER
jgi:hypothetical protein